MGRMWTQLEREVVLLAAGLKILGVYLLSVVMTEAEVGWGGMLNHKIQSNVCPVLQPQT